MQDISMASVMWTLALHLWQSWSNSKPLTVSPLKLGRWVREAQVFQEGTIFSSWYHFPSRLAHIFMYQISTRVDSSKFFLVANLTLLLIYLFLLVELSNTLNCYHIDTWKLLTTYRYNCVQVDVLATLRLYANECRRPFTTNILKFLHSNLFYL